MARVLGYGGVANTNGARTFSGKAEAAATFVGRPRMGYTQYAIRGFRSIVFLLLGM